MGLGTGTVKRKKSHICFSFYRVFKPYSMGGALVAKIILAMFVVALLATSGNCAALTDEEKLGKLLYFDTDLSTPTGQSCASCQCWF